MFHVYVGGEVWTSAPVCRSEAEAIQRKLERQYPLAIVVVGFIGREKTDKWAAAAKYAF